jgi:multidrug transporter EmrE-like cation transporter
MITAVHLGLNVFFSVVSNAAFRISARSATWSAVLTWQLVGNAAGLTGVIALTCMLRDVPLGIAFPLTTGMSVLGVQLVAATWLFREPINVVQWSGSLLIGVGLVLVLSG